MTYSIIQQQVREALEYTICYSVRKLRQSYTGYCMRVRRSSDNTTQDIGFVGRDLDTASLLTFCGAGNGFVTIWYNQGIYGSDYDVVQTTVANQPKIVSSGAVMMENGIAALDFDGTDTLNIAADKTCNLGSPISIFCVANPTKVVPGLNDVYPSWTRLIGNIVDNYFYLGRFWDYTVQAMYGNGSYWQYTGSNGYTLRKNSDIYWHNYQAIIGTTQDGTDTYCFFNGQQITKVTELQMASYNGRFSVGGLFGSETRQQWVGTIQEVLMYKGLKLGVRTVIETDINNYYNVPYWMSEAPQPTPQAVYSLRLINTSYAGHCIKVRRSSDNTEQDIGFSSGVLDTSALLTFVGAGNGFVSAWYDQGVSAKNFVQTDTTKQPQVVSAGSVLLENGKPTLVSGANTVMACTTLVVAQPSWYFVVARTSTVVNDKHYIDGVTSRNLIGTAKGKLCSYAGSVLNFATKATTQELIYALFNGANSAIGRNGAAAVTGNAGTANLSSPSIFNNIIGSIQEIIIYPSYQYANRSTIESDINGFYSIY